MLDNETWKCSICDYKGKFGLEDTIGVHVKGMDHIHQQYWSPLPLVHLAN